MLDKNDKECLTYMVDNKAPFQVSSSLTNLQLLNEDAEITIEFDGNKSYVMTTNAYTFSADILKENCPSEEPNSCEITVRYNSFDNEITLETIAQKLDGVITLYDGVVQKMNSTLSANMSASYRYPLDTQ
jgi:hypothetical protein